MYSILAESSNMFPCNWNEFIPSIISTFVGFILALIGDYLLETYLENRKNNREAKDLLDRLVGELEVVKKVLSDCSDYTLDKKPLKTPVWDEAISAGMISLVGTEIRQKLFVIYKKINELNSWYEIKTEFYFAHIECDDVSKRYNPELDKEINKMKELLLGDVEYDAKTHESEKLTIQMVIDAIKLKNKR